ncbi:hypothetical protein F2Q68_00029739 [Brassica cretica]|uniref:Uncharacterized protein n=1 Tax=Brassica cretica TaxID=69181 RepID=A0A8S9G7Q3_BRACR|nr:hypothetical protein F2Q68_00029739 [Brassica cretica]
MIRGSYKGRGIWIMRLMCRVEEQLAIISYGEKSRGRVKDIVRNKSVKSRRWSMDDAQNSLPPSLAIDGLSYNQLNKAGAPQGLSSMLCLSKLARTCAVPDTTAYCLKASRRLFHMGSPSNEKDPQEVLHATDKTPLFFSGEVSQQPTMDHSDTSIVSGAKEREE